MFAFPTVRTNGRFVTFGSFATNLVPQADTNGVADVFYRDTCIGAPAGCTPDTIRVSVASNGGEANDGSGEPWISADGRFVVFDSLATNLVPGGTNAPKSVFLRDTCLGPGAPTGCQTTTILLSRTTDGIIANGISASPVISADGKWVVFLSDATNLLPGVADGRNHVYLARTGY